jgi:uncharacterized protein
LSKTLKYSLLPGRYAICRLGPAAVIPDWALAPSEFCSVSRTSDELSIVCPQDRVPSGLTVSQGWICLKLKGPFAFSETGVLTSFLNPLAEHGIGIFAVSTFDTDYVLIHEKCWAKAAEVLHAAGHELVNAGH